ncbi:NADPH-dependent FMN reductase [Allomuricauda sp. SCSIO 65647]|uniref:NADPH-dependent FMN reductase n=1 Tax=Allomuricauda sp. SCSIO 65647 TaxID=2908843 RepID=UPI001F4392B2|nr:NAD(P)H-dependent oxidoreductase [Muricauda sp. SCSIO 65647]UJH67500.1 NAD(P)H-dependent oxidoreductase [Muricauda sp. SCSIO 65647]
MARILAFAGSNSSTSINYKLVKYTTSLVNGHEMNELNMANYPFPLFSVDLEKKEGYSNSLIELKNEIQKADGVILSVNEHNSYPSAYFKNLVDWLSRIERKFLVDTKVLLMSTSQGKRGGFGSLEVSKAMLSRFGGDILATFSLPSFNENFEAGKGIVDPNLKDEHERALMTFLSSF